MSKPKCSVMDCTKEVTTANKCHRHYRESRQNDPNRQTCRRCEKAAMVRGLCSSCYHHVRNTKGTYEVESTKGKCVKFLEKLEDTNECILWPYGCCGSGYGELKIDGVFRSAHSVSLSMRIPKPCEDAYALHASHDLCGNKRCVNPRHLRWGTPSQNMHDKRKDGTAGSKLDPDNVRAIMRMYAEGKTQKNIADLMGVVASHISHILLGYKWSHITGITCEAKQ